MTKKERKKESSKSLHYKEGERVSCIHFIVVRVSIEHLDPGRNKSHTFRSCSLLVTSSYIKRLRWSHKKPVEQVGIIGEWVKKRHSLLLVVHSTDHRQSTGTGEKLWMCILCEKAEGFHHFDSKDSDLAENELWRNPCTLKVGFNTNIRKRLRLRRCTTLVARNRPVLHDWALFACITWVHLATQVCRWRVGGSFVNLQAVSSVCGSLTSRRHHALSASFPLLVPGQEWRSGGIGPQLALHGIPGPEPFGLPEVGFRRLARDHYIQIIGEHDWLGWLRLQSERRHAGGRYRHGGTRVQWKLLQGKKLTTACEACVMFPPWKTHILCSFCPCSPANITHSCSFLVFFGPFRIIMPQGTPCLWRTRSRATLSSPWTKVTVKPAWAFRGPSCRVISKTSESLWDI